MTTSTAARHVDPRFTVIVAVRNAASTVEAALQSAFDQGPDAEVVVIDGASTDGTVAILERHAGRLAHWESRPDTGIYQAWNRALPHARGEWLHFLGADDRFAGPDVLTRVSRALDAIPDRTRVAYGRVRLQGLSGESVVVGAPWQEAAAAFEWQMAIPHQAVFHHRSLFERHGMFDETFRICGDYEFLLRELRNHEPAFLGDIVVADMGDVGVSSRPESERRMRREFHRARHANGLTRVPAWLAPAVVRIEVRDWIGRTFGGRVARTSVRAYQRVASRPSRRRR